MDKKNIVVLGGGFGGLRAAIDLSKKIDHKEWVVILIDRNNYQTFTPSLYEVASAFGVAPDAYSIKLRKTIAVPFDEVRNSNKINFVQAEIDRVDLENRKVVTRGGQLFDFEYCVIALGAETDNFGIPGVSEYAYMMKTIDDGVAINQKLNSLFKEAQNEKRSLPIRIVVGGGGFNGIETATELACCAKNLAKLCGLDQNCREITIIEAMPKILPMIGDKEREKIFKRLKELNISIMEGEPIIEVKPQNIILKSGRQVGFDILIWSSGIKANSFLKNIKRLELDEKGRVKVNQNLQTHSPSSGQANTGVFAIGDNIWFADPKTEKPIPGMAYLAIEQGRLAAENIFRQIKNKKSVAYKPKYDYWIAPVGGKNAIANIFGKVFTGFAGWLIREAVDLKYLMGVLPAGRAVKAFSESTEVFIKND